MSKSTRVNCCECLFKRKETYKINEAMVAALNYLDTVFFKCMIHLSMLMFLSRDTFRF